MFSTLEWTRPVAALVALIVAVSSCNDNDQGIPPPGPGDPAAEIPALDQTVYLGGLSMPWDLAFLPNGELLLTERGGRIRLRRAAGTVITVAQPTDVVVSGEGGLLGLALDPQFATNRFVYTCFSSNRGGTNDNRVVRWELSADGTQLAARTDIVTGLPWANGGRHSGCRPRFGPDGMLWVGTGDAAVGTNAQNLQSLGGKVLRVTRDGTAAPGNPTIASADARIYSYGHRNVQGVAFHPVTQATWTVEHGPSSDDEVNQLTPGANAGWNPVPGYNESVSMTDLTRYPNALRAIFSTGSPARGSSGGTFITGAAWKAFQNAFVVAQLVGARLQILILNTNGSVKNATTMYADLSTRLRVPVMGPDGALYVATDVGGSGGQIWRIAPRP
ncbi:MAG: PQQ-dependent sugar dehydrogenase [Phycisphaerae bacterium]|nr:PQQ-dependent sugar dehydrogenase [Gemmatimonadaceae bacterium]